MYKLSTGMRLLAAACRYIRYQYTLATRCCLATSFEYKSIPPIGKCDRLHGEYSWGRQRRFGRQATSYSRNNFVFPREGNVRTFGNLILTIKCVLTRMEYSRRFLATVLVRSIIFWCPGSTDRSVKPTVDNSWLRTSGSFIYTT